ncbi:MAG: hypothetical protein V4726_12855 [Verrucomicrobiota bacterium]
MASDNRISLEISPEKKAAIEAAIAALKDELKGITFSLSEDERTRLPRVADKTFALTKSAKATWPVGRIWCRASLTWRNVPRTAG